MPKMIITLSITITNNKKERSINYQKQTQSKPIFKGQAGLNSFFHFVIVHYKATADVGNKRIRYNKAEFFISVN